MTLNEMNGDVRIRFSVQVYKEEMLNGYEKGKKCDIR